MDVKAWIVVGLVIAAALVWFRLRVSGRAPSKAGPPPKNPSDKRARDAIKAAGAAAREEIAADLEGGDPAGDLARRANRKRR